MSRSKNNLFRKKHHAKVLIKTRGYYGRLHKSYRLGQQALDKSFSYLIISRKLYKRTNKINWNQIVSSNLNPYGLKFNTLKMFIKLNGLSLDRKNLSYLLCFESRLAFSLINWCRISM